MSDHELIVSIGTGGYLGGEIRCNATQEAGCRNIPDCGCEAYSGLGRDDQGWFHVAGEYVEAIDDYLDVKHRHHRSDECNICNWLNADDPMDCFAGHTYFSLSGIPIEPVWAGDFYEWKPVNS